MIYVALLRGINVGGNNLINMKALRQSFEKAGMKSVRSYINSGNIIFEHPVFEVQDLVNRLEAAIQADFHLSIKVLIRSFDQFQMLMQQLPETWKNDAEMKSDVLFLWDDINQAEILQELKIKPEIDTVHYVDGALLWSIKKSNRTKSGLQKLIGHPLYKKMTIRNINTTRKIFELMQEIERTTPSNS